jgi:hypothetical protein
MPKLEDVIQLKDDEQVKAIARRHGITLVPWLVLALVLIVTPFFFLFPLFGSGPAGIVVFLATVIAGIIVAFRSFMMWDGDLLIVTNQRIVDVDQQGVFARTVNEITYGNIQDLAWSKGSVLDYVLRIGTVRMRSDSGSLTIEAKHVAHPQMLQNLINDLWQESIHHRSSAPAPFQAQSSGASHRDDLIKQVAGRVETLDDEGLAKLARTLKAEDREIAITHLFGEKKEGTLKELDDKSV